MTTTTRNVDAPATHSRARTRALAVGAAALAATALWTAAVPLLGIALTVRTTPGRGAPQTVGVVAVLAVSLLASLLGWGLLAALERRTSSAGTIWTVTSVGVLILSLAGPITAATTPTAAATLVALHLGVAAVLIPTLRRSAARR